MSCASFGAPQIVQHLSSSVNFTPFDTRWIPCSARFVVVGDNPRGTGAIRIFELNEKSLALVGEKDTKCGLKCGTFAASLAEDRHLSTGDFKGNLDIWDLEYLDSPVFSVEAHSSIINSIDGCGGLGIGGGSPELVTGGRDGCVRIWDPRQRNSVAALEPESGCKTRECWAVAFGNSYDDEQRSVCAGYDNGDVKMLDLRTNKLLWETNTGQGVVSIQYDRKNTKMNKLLVTTLESKFWIYDLRTFHPKEGFSSLCTTAQNSTIWKGKHLPQNRDIFATLAGNGSMNLWKYCYPVKRCLKDPKGQMLGVMGTVDLLNSEKLSEQPIVSFDWSVDKQGLCVMTCLDATVKVIIVTKLKNF